LRAANVANIDFASKLFYCMKVALKLMTEKSNERRRRRRL